MSRQSNKTFHFWQLLKPDKIRTHWDENQLSGNVHVPFLILLSIGTHSYFEIEHAVTVIRNLSKAEA